MTVGYNVIQGSDKGRATNKLNDIYARPRRKSILNLKSFPQTPTSPLSTEDLYWNKVPGDILLRLKKAAEDALYHHLWYDEKGGYPREYTYKGNDNAILYQILTCADCLDAATDSVGRAYSSGKNFADMLADLRYNAGRMFNPDLVQLFDSEQLQQQIETLITVDRGQLYREVFGKNVSLVL